MDQMDLAQIGLAGIKRHPRTMLNRLAKVRVPLNAQSGQQPNALLIWFAKHMGCAETHSGYDSTHRLLFLLIHCSAYIIHCPACQEQPPILSQCPPVSQPPQLEQQSAQLQDVAP